MAKQDKKQAEVFHFDLYGKRDDKYNFLNQNSIGSILWGKLEPSEPNYFFTVKNFVDRDTYDIGFKVDDLFKINSSGIKTHRDHFVIDFQKQTLLERIVEFYNFEYTDSEIKQKFNLKDNRDWSVSLARKKESYNPQKVKLIEYRPFDNRFCYYDNNLIDFGRENVMKHFFHKGNFGLSLLRQSRTNEVGNYWINKSIIGKDAISSLDTCTCFPLYLFEESSSQQTINSASERIPNLNPEIVNQLAKKLGLTFTNEKETTPNTFAPIDILDYIYAVLHSPTYREKYKEFLKIDFPRVPYPTNQETFWQLVKLGGELRQIHLLESPVVEKYTTQYPVDGDNMVNRIRFSTYLYDNAIPDENGNINYPDYLGSVYINETQYFANVPTSAWNFYIGGYQPAQKWLKDRKGRTLEFEDILHYQKIIVALTETDRLMKEIDLIVL